MEVKTCLRLIVYFNTWLIMRQHAEGMTGSSDCYGLDCLNGGSLAICNGMCHCQCQQRFSGIFCEYEIQKSTWPPGPYALPTAIDGCPETIKHGWGKGYINFTSIIPFNFLSTQHVSKGNLNGTALDDFKKSSLMGPIGKYTLQINFCFKAENQFIEIEQEWPDGNYSIYRADGCPTGFYDQNMTIPLPPLLHWNSDGYLPDIDVSSNENNATLNIRLCHRDSSSNGSSPSWSNSFMLLKIKTSEEYSEDCPLWKGYEVSEQTFYMAGTIILNDTNRDARLAFCFYIPSNITYGEVKKVYFLEDHLTHGYKVIFGVHAVFPDEYKDEFKDFSINTGLYRMRSKFQELCYKLTEKDMHLVNTVTNMTERTVCESYPFHFWTNGNNEEYPGCGLCSCCQVPGCYVSSGTYTGTWSTGINDNTCQRWDEQTPIAHKYNESYHYPHEDSIYDAHNYCRAPESSSYLWCYQMEPTRRWDSCNIPKCTDTVFAACYEWTNKEKEMMKNGISSQEICEKDPNHRWMLQDNLDRNRYLNCADCSCCKIRGCYKDSITYNGMWSTTLSGRTCQRWDTQTPHGHPFNSTIHQFANNESNSEAQNYCRDPVGPIRIEGMPWCYTTDENVRWESCDIPLCDEIKVDDRVACYAFTENEVQLLNRDVGISEPMICESYPDHFWAHGNSNNSQGCGACSCCQRPGCYTGESTTYAGTWSTTISGLTCQRWDSQIPHEHTGNNPDRFINDASLRDAHNYCRDPDGEAFPWCYTTDPERRWETCGINPCDKGAKDINTDSMPWILLDLGQAVTVGAIKTTLKKDYIFDDEVFNGKDTIERDDTPNIYISNDKWTFLNHGAELCRYNGYYIETVMEMFFYMKFLRPKTGRYVALVTSTYKNHADALSLLLRITTTLVYTPDQHSQKDASKACRRELGMKDGGIQDFQVSASSWQGYLQPSRGRLSGDGWCANKDDVDPFLQVDLLSPTTVEGVVISNWVRTSTSYFLNVFKQNISPTGCRSFTLYYGTSVDFLNQYMEKVFYLDLSREYTEPQTFLLLQPVLARYVRLYPRSLVANNPPCMKIELLGCKKSGLPSLNCYSDATRELMNVTEALVSANKPFVIQGLSSVEQCSMECQKTVSNCSTTEYRKLDGVCNLYTYSNTQHYHQLISDNGKTSMSSFICWKEAVEIKPLLISQKQVKVSEAAMGYITKETVITNFGYPFYYDANQVVKWNIKFASGKFIKLMFAEVSLHRFMTNDAECTELIIISESETTLPVLTDIENGNRGDYVIDNRFNGFTPTIATSVSQLFLIFSTCPALNQRSYIGKGFRAFVKGDVIATCFSRSHGTSHYCEMTTMFLASGSFLGLPVVHSRNEYWTLGGDKTSLRIIILSISAFNVACTSGSQFEIGQIGPNGDSDVHTYCNKNRPVGEISSKYDRLTIRFYYNTASNLMSTEGFRASYKTMSTNKKLFSASSDEVCSSILQKCYTVIQLSTSSTARRQKTSWNRARDLCSSINQNMATIHSDVENKFIRQYLEYISKKHLKETLNTDVFFPLEVDPLLYVHIGLFRYKADDGKVHELWEDGSPLTFTAWDTFQPSELLSRQCTRMGFHLVNQQNTWESERCTVSGQGSAHYSICEKRLTVTTFNSSSSRVATIENLLLGVKNLRLQTPNDDTLFFHCDSLEWITSLALCDGIPDCLDGSDERDCKEEISDACDGDMFQCDNGQCIHISEVCNYIQDCDDGSDEYCGFKNCLKDEFQCDNKQCLPGYLRCDAVTDCDDLSDETNCASCNSTTAFQCNDMTCISILLVCDNFVDCADGKDEHGCDITTYRSCDQWWQAGFRKTGMYEIDGQEVECDFGQIWPYGIIKTILHSIEFKPNTKDTSNKRTLRSYLDYNMTFVTSLSNNPGYYCQQNLTQTCDPGRLDVLQYDGINERSHSQCICLRHRLNVSNGYSELVYCDDSAKDMPSPETFSLYIPNIHGTITQPSVSFPSNINQDIELDIGPIECIQVGFDHIKTDSTLVCEKERQVIPAARRCLYDINHSGIMNGCRSLQHLEKCEKFQCPQHYVKCPGSFCIALRYVCDGESQCAGGEDEINCWCKANTAEIAIVYHGQANENLRSNAYKLAQQLNTPSNTIRMLKYTQSYSDIYCLDQDLNITDELVDNYKKDKVNTNLPLVSKKNASQVTVIPIGSFLQYLNSSFSSAASSHAIIYLRDSVVSSDGLTDLFPVDNCSIYLANKDVYHVTENKSISLKVKHVTHSNMTTMVVKKWNTLGSAGSTLFPKMCNESIEAVCTGQYRCAATRVCIPISQVCDGLKHCLDGDDERLCNFKCPSLCSCRGYSVNCSQSRIESGDFESISSLTRKLDLSFSLSFSQEEILNISKDYSLLVEFNISYCAIKSVGRDTFKTMINLLILDISYNQIKTIHAETFVNLNVLRELILTGNYQLHTIEPGAFAGLLQVRELIITNSMLRLLSKRTFVRLNLTYLDLSNNELYTIQDLTFKDMNVYYINLEGNSITDFSKDMFTGVRSLKRIVSSSHKFCCIRPASVQTDDCFPHRDEFSSCGDLMRHAALQSILWVIGLSALVGNLLSLIYRMKYERHKFKLGYGIFVSNLAVADFLMGVYLIIIATADQVYRNRYIWMDEIWRNSAWCKLAGILSTISSESSVLFMVFITMDRLIVIKFPLGRTRFNTKSALIVSALCWLLVCTIALLPVWDTDYFQNHFYSKSGVCLALPLTRDRPPGWEYSIGIFIGFNFLIFILIAIGQCLIYMEVRKMSQQMRGAHSSRRNDMQVAKNLLLVVTTDFLCWFPVGCMGMLAVSGYVISGDVYAWTAVLILPINSALNPFLYTLSACCGQKMLQKNGCHKKYARNNTQETVLCNKL